MTPTKYRAYVKSENKTFDVWGISLNREKVKHIGIIGHITPGWAAGRKHFVKTDRVMAGNFILRQYTTMQDVNGDDIYDGDILSDGKHFATVEWSSEFAGWLFTQKKGEYNPKLNSDTLAIVGNIYENPELVNGD